VPDKVKEKTAWLKDTGKKVQHDGTKPHNDKGNEVFLDQAGSANGWNTQFIAKPAQSPELNVLNLGFFASL
jgi:hypothetical protein